MPHPFARRTLASLKKDARRWLAALAAGDPDARARLRRILPDAPDAPTLRDVQLALAREQGFDGWTALKRALEPDPARSAATLAQYDDMAEALLDAYRTGTPEAMERHYRYTWHRRAWSGMRRYVQLDLGKRPGEPDGDVAISLDDARWLVARERGFETWDALRASVANLPGGAPHVTTVAQAKALALREAIERGDATTLDLGGVRDIGDADLVDIGRLTRLERLDLSGTSITDAGVWHLRGCDALRDVNLAWTATGDGALRALAGKPHLHTFRSGNGVTDDGIALLHEWPVFKTWQGGPERIDLLGPTPSPNLLWLRGPFTDRGLARLRGLDGLFALNLDDARLALTAACLDSLRELPRLASLAVDAKDDWMPGHRAAAGAALPHRPGHHRERRRLGRARPLAHHRADLGPPLSRPAAARVPCAVGDAGAARAVRQLPERRRRRPRRAAALPCPARADADGRPRRRLPAHRTVPELESLILMYCRDTTDAASEHLPGLSKLTYYFNSYTTITDRTPEILSTMDALERITFDACHGLTDSGVARLARLPRLRELRVSGRGVTAAVGRPFPPTVAVHREP